MTFPASAGFAQCHTLLGQVIDGLLEHAAPAGLATADGVFRLLDAPGLGTVARAAASLRRHRRGGEPRPRESPYGVRKRVALARAVVSEPRLLASRSCR